MSELLLRQQIEQFILANKNDIVNNLARLIAIPSVKGSPQPGAPFGVHTRRALDTMLDIAEGMGLATNHGDGYIGWAEIPGRSPRYLAAIAHLDVVPAGEGWNTEPFTLTQREGWLLGRGVIDDKGPAIISLYAAKFIKESGIPLPYSLRVLFGCDEENGMQDVDYYLANQPQPLFCVTPDADFPLGNGEKGIFSGRFSSAPAAGRLVEFCSGTAGNVIPERASCIVIADASTLQNTGRVTAEPAGEGKVKLTAQGMGGHAALPAGTINAIGLLVDYLIENQLYTPEELPFLQLLQLLHHHTDGSGLGIACTDPRFTPLTCIGGVTSLMGGRLHQDINIRYPSAISSKEITCILQEKAALYGAVFTPLEDEKPFFTPEDAPSIQALLQAYAQVTGKPANAFTRGGGTYARHFSHAVSYGLRNTGTPLPAFVGSMHGPNEGASLDDLLEGLKIYIVALNKLQQLDFDA